MATNYPGSLDTGTQQPSPLSTTEMDDAGFEHDVVHTNHSEAIIALETKVGVGSSSAVADSVLAGTGSGTSSWSTAPSLAGLTVDTDTLHVDATNNRVGIGTTSPGAQLQISNTGSGQLYATGDGFYIDQSASQLDTLFLRSQGPVDISSDFDGGTSNDYIRFLTDNSTERVRITQDGNVGIGTTTPAQTLQVVSDGGNLSSGNVADETKGTIHLENSGGAKADGALSTGISFSGTNTGRRRALISAFQDGTDGDPHGLQFFTYGSTSSGSDAVTSRMTIDSGGKVGIGTTSPGAPLHLFGSGNSVDQIRISSTGGTLSEYGFLAANASTNVMRYGYWTGSGFGNHHFEGKVGIGTTTPAGTLDVDGNVRATSAQISGNIFNSGVIESDGTYSNTTGLGANMHISSGGFFYRSTSSGKYKTDVETMEDSYADSILGLRPVWYRSLSEHDPDSWGYWGFIAEEVAEIDPRLVSFGVPDDYEWQYDEEGQKLEPAVADLTEPEGVQYDRMVPHLINLLARQRDQIVDLSSRVAALEAA